MKKINTVAVVAAFLMTPTLVHSKEISDLIAQRDSLKSQIEALAQLVMDSIMNTVKSTRLSPDCMAEMKAAQGAEEKLSPKCLAEEETSIKAMLEVVKDNKAKSKQLSELSDRMTAVRLKLIDALQAASAQK